MTRPIHIKPLLGVAALLLSLVAWPVATHVLAKSRLASYRRTLAAKGEKLGIEALSPVPTPEAVAALQRLTVVVSATGGSPTITPPTMRFLTNSGTAICASRQPVFPTDESANTWDLLELEFSGKEERLMELRELLPGCRLATIQDYSQSFSLSIAHLSAIKSAAQWLSAAAVRDLHNGAHEEAFKDLRALASLARGYDGEPTMIAVLVRLAVSAIAFNATWEGLQSDRISDSQWAEIQAIWREIDLLEHAEQALAMERAMGEDFFARGRRSYAAVTLVPGSTAGSALDDLVEVSKKALAEPLDAWNEFRHRFPGYWRWKYWGSYEDELVNLKVFQAAIEAFRETRHGCSCAPMLRLPDEVDRILGAHPRSGQWLIGLYAPDGYVRSFKARLVDLEVQKRLLVTAIGLKRFQLRHGSYPASLNELVPEFVPSLPADLDGAALRYRLETPQGWTLYSVGLDLKDDGGAAVSTGKTIADRRRWYRFQDAVWPSAASEQEVQSEFERIYRRRQQRQAEQGGEKVGP